MRKLTPFIWFDNNAEEAANYYVSVFPNSEITSILRHDASSAKANNMPEGSVLTISFNLDGNEFVGINGGPHFKLSSAISFMIPCETQEEIDHYWSKLTEGGQEMDCGWAVDKFGLTWQITPTVLPKYLSDSDKEKSNRVMQEMLKMKKLEIEPLEKAYRG